MLQALKDFGFRLWYGMSREEVVKITKELYHDMENLLLSSKPHWKRPDSDTMIDLTTDQCIWMLEHSQCCYCGGDLFGGPSGGASQNMYCGNVVECNSAFNLSGMIPWGQFIGSVPKSFKEWRLKTEDNIE